MPSPFVSLGIIACPGSRCFAEKLIQQLESIEHALFRENCTAIAKNYHLSVEEVIVKKNLLADMIANTHICRETPDVYHNPKFLVDVRHTRFANGEVKAEILDSVRSKDIYIVQDVYTGVSPEYYGTQADSYSVNDHLMTLLTTIDAVRSSSPGRITCILPAYPYARQHKRKSREGLTAALVGSIMESMSVDRILTLDIHSRDIDNTFKQLQLISLHASYEILRCMVKIVDPKTTDMVVVSPDTGAVDRNKYYANSLGCPLAMLYKERDYSKVSRDGINSNISSLRLLGNVEGKTVFLADDMLGTGGTLIKALQELKSAGAQKVIVGISLPLFTGASISLLEEAHRKGYFDKLIGTNAVAHNEDLYKRPWYISADVSKLFAEAVSTLHHDGSLSPLLDNKQQIQDLLNS